MSGWMDCLFSPAPFVNCLLLSPVSQNIKKNEKNIKYSSSSLSSDAAAGLLISSSLMV